MINILLLPYCRNLMVSSRIILNVGIPQKSQQTIATHQKESWCIVLCWACLSPTLALHFITPWSCKGSETNEMEFFALDLGWYTSRSTVSPKLQYAVLPSCSAVRSHPTPAVRLQDLTKYTTNRWTPHFLLGFCDELLAFLLRQKVFSLASAKGKFHPLKSHITLFLRPGRVQLVLLLEEDHMSLFASHIAHQVILLSVGLHLPFYTLKVVASSFDEITLIDEIRLTCPEHHSSKVDLQQQQSFIEVQKGGTYTGFSFFQIDGGPIILHLVFTDDLERQKKSNSQMVDRGWKDSWSLIK